jgi:hypothetical protein
MKKAQVITSFYIYEMKEMAWLTLKGLKLIKSIIGTKGVFLKLIDDTP